jgi:hypothetical protein
VPGNGAGSTASRETAVPVLGQSLKLASRAGDKAVQAEALRHLGIAAQGTGQMEVARQRPEESTRPRHEIGLVSCAWLLQLGPPARTADAGQRIWGGPISTRSVASVLLISRMTLPGNLWPPLKRHPEATSG